MTQQSEDILYSAAKRNWAINAQTQEFVKELEAKKQELLTNAMNLSIVSPPNLQLIHINTTQAKTLQNVIDKINKL